MPSKTGVDKYANIINLDVTESATDTLTFTEIDIGFSMFERMGLMIHRLEWTPENAFYNALAADADQLTLAITASNTITDINADERAVIDTVRLRGILTGAAANYQMLATLPVTRSFTDLPGGGILVAPRPLFAGIVGASMPAAITAQLRVYFTVVKLADTDYFELLESRRFYG